ncbi:tetratricopeptide repeat protein [Salinicola salarius]|uniref:tetratricopeptide repeat protein n=1 Tax=Salinicola salarius TaxID=430457 RepID=UPI00142DDC40|nr:tetratricopeptide repeat protein [Salinicola salarius]MDF3919497.1 tetratricopeptide repeat protein [Salinicola salarius]MEC8916697.1 tetratricopeptide repeat protein [Pseudomonadota bacterium]MED5500942.1 tetratricopeptide repeat protein [Pseudomonadota bacterium]
MAIVDPRTGQPLTGPEESSQNGAGNNVAPEDVIVDVTLENFQQVVLEGSMQHPVLLQSWASWCEPCKNLKPVLEKLAQEYAGAFVLARLDIEAFPQIASQLGVRSVPDVKLISQGQLYDQFQGALPEKQVREWLGKYLEAPANASQSPEEMAEAALASGDTETAEAIYQELIQQYPEHYDYQIELAGVRVAAGQTADAKQILDNLPPEHRDAAKARGVRARIEFGEEALSQADIDALGERDDSEAQYQRAMRQIADGQYEAGLEALLAVMKRDRAYGEDAARKTLLRVFDALGAEHPLTVTYRRRLFAMLY